MKRKLFRTNLTLATDSFEQLKSQFIYVEDEYNETINTFLLQNYENILLSIRTRCHNAEFVFIPQLFKDITTSGDGFEKLLTHYFPSLISPARNSPQLDYFTTPFFTRLLFSNSDYNEEVTPGLIRCLEKEESGYLFEYVQFDLSDSESFTKQIVDYIMTVPKESGIPKETATTNAIETAQQQVFRSEGTGIYEYIFYKIGSLINDEPRKLSRLIIDSDYKITLPYYDNLEIEMKPIPKSLYILFLRYPDGIILKDIADYEDELWKIYNHISNWEDFDRMRQNIHRICSLADNSINEKISLIRAAFTRQSGLINHLHQKYIEKNNSYNGKNPAINEDFFHKLAEEDAEQYVITRGRGVAKHIPLVKHDKNSIELPDFL
jgi:hypothetical protein